MPAETALALVVRGSDWSESSRIATLWSREFGKLRVLAKGGRRIKSTFETALDLLNVCRIAVIRKSSMGLDLLTEASVAEHDLVSELYHIIEGTATLMLGPDIVNPKRRPATLETVRLFNGPGNNGTSIRNGIAYELKPGDVVIIPAGTGHWFTRIDDHILYLMVRIDPDKVTPHKTEAESKTYLSTPPSGRSQQ